ncbi:MAG: glycogen debranching protein GlgX [Edaphobacter sp.]|uniref:glycogen debranching protein GlgX n=1 Tax=Edaphobacter sp. TaxID=1934404 RepID=UPI0023A63E90|nr:glycogen debranching protein GlgX [Edaphobacter sp.]MDE1177139.1 glycogen debranching protein GlgX [Edaphobacter sp.]
MKAGHPYPLGATLTDHGVNFSIFSSHARGMHLLLFDSPSSPWAARTIALDPTINRTGHYWHIEVPDLVAGQTYAYRADGPYLPEAGYLFDSNKVLLDPYGRSVCTHLYDRAAAKSRNDNETVCMRNIVIDLGAYDWEGDQPLGNLFHETIIYELQVGGFTRHPESGVSPEKRGTFAGVIEKIPYLQQLGITAVELMPIFQFDAQDAPLGLENYWGYSPVSFFAPHLAYSVSQSPLGCLNEFRDMVKALHRAGIEVILDVVYNHTAEAGANGPTFGFKGLDNSLYYMLSADRARFADYTGTGNTLNSNHSVVRRLILDSLRYWVSEMHVDGFRFDLAAVLSRDETGTPVPNAPIIWDIDADPILAGTKLMAEAWDADGLYQVGSFSRDRWKEWNGRFRDDIRTFLKSSDGSIAHLQQRLLGSPDIYNLPHHPPEQSINFVTCHDGFTLNDLVSYDQKHNLANGEQNRDGLNENLSWNCGVEGPTEDENINALRERQIRNAFVLNLFSVGTPLLLMGDEVRRTQQGNNNAYCQNNEISWFDWTLCEKNSSLLRFVSILIHMRRSFGSTFEGHALSLRGVLESAHIDWHGVHLNSPDLSHQSHTLAATVYTLSGPAFHVIFNAYWEPLTFALPAPVPPGPSWFRIIDTALPSPEDIVLHQRESITDAKYNVAPRSIVLLGNLACQPPDQQN